MSLRCTFTGSITVYEIHHFVCGEWSIVEPSWRMTGKEIADSFSPSGSCWQYCGVNGTLEERTAIQAYFALKRGGYKYPIRVVKRDYQVIEEVLPDSRLSTALID